MASALEEREEQSSKCFICNVKVTTRSSYNIYCTFMPRRELLLIDVMSKILKKILNPSQMRSSVLCRRCFTLFDELDQISTRFKKLQTDIIKRYTSTCIEYKDDNFLNMTPSKIEELSHSEQENDDKSFNDDDEGGEKSSLALNEIVENIISNIQAEETINNDKDLKECTSKTSKNKIVLIDEEVTKHMDGEVAEHIDDDVAEHIDKEVAEHIDEEVTNHIDREVTDHIDGEVTDHIDREVTDHTDGEITDRIDGEVTDRIDGEVTDHIDAVDNPLSDVDEPIRETKLSKRSVGIHYKCEQCDDSFQRASDLKNHFTMIHQTPKRHFCSPCDKSYSTKQSLNNHLTKEHKILVKDTINDQDDSIPAVVKTENETLQCDSDSNIVCEASADYISDTPEGVVISVKPEFSIHNNIYMEEVEQEENEDDDFEWKEQLNYNSKNIIEDSSSAIDETIAPLSGSEKSDKRQIKKERKKRGSSRSGERACLPAIHSCALCGKKWRTVTELKSHIQSHSSIRPYVCEICGQAYKMKKALDVHIGMHNGIHPFTCEYCNKSFTQKVGLQKHIPIHTGYTRFQCDLCGKRFIHQKSFHIHTMTHTGEKHVKCPECGLAVLSQSHLKRHLRVHTGERPYACPICGKRFAEKYNMNAHVHIHENNTGNGPRRNRNHICQLCGMSYDRKHKLEYHLASAHNKIDSKISQDQELVQLQQPKIEYFQENSQGHQIITVDNNAIDHNGSTTMITVSGVKLPISIDGAPIMVTTMPQQPHTTNLVPLNIPAGSLLAYGPSNTNDNNDQQMVDGSQNAYMPQNPVTIQLS